MTDELSVFAHAERIQESGDNYRAYNAGSKAAGAYQFEPGTWRYALGLAGLGSSIWAGMSARDAPPAVQDAAAEALMSLYYNQFGHSWYNVAEAWYGGPGAVGHPDWGGGPGYPNVGQYATKVYAIYLSLLLGTTVGGGPPLPPEQANPGSNEWRQVNTIFLWMAGVYGTTLTRYTNEIISNQQW